MKHWLNYFEHNRRHRNDIPWERTIQVPPQLLPPLINSLQKFQVGESGEGRHLRKQAATTLDSTYQAAIDLFIKEEQEHARRVQTVFASEKRGRQLQELGKAKTNGLTRIPMSRQGAIASNNVIEIT